MNYCDKIIRTATALGTNKAWFSRVKDGSLYEIKGNGDKTYIQHPTDYSPFGSIVPPEPVIEPSKWDSKEDVDTQPLFIEPPDTKNYHDPYQARAGQPFYCPCDLSSSSCDLSCNLDDASTPDLDEGENRAKARLQRLFARDYGCWEFYSTISVSSEGGECENLSYCPGGVTNPSCNCCTNLDADIPPWKKCYPTADGPGCEDGLGGIVCHCLQCAD